MYNVTEGYLDTLKQKVRKDSIEGEITLSDGTLIEINDDVLVSGSLKLTKELCGEKYRVGTFNLSCLKFSIFIENALGIDLTGATVRLDYRLRFPESGYELVPLGIYLADPVLSVRRKNILSVVAYDVGVLADREPSALLRGMTCTPAELIAAVCGECGIDTDITAGSLTINAGDRQIQSCRDIIMWCAALVCGYAVIDRQSKLVILPAKYEVSPSDSSVILTDRTIAADERQSICVTDTRAYIKYLTAYKNSDIANYTSSYVSPDEQAAPAAYSLDKNPLLAGKTDQEWDSANRAWLAHMDSFKQRGVQAVIFGDPAIDTGDTVMFRGGDVDQRGGIIGIVTATEWVYRGYQKIVCSAAECVGSLVSGSNAGYSSTAKTRSQTAKRIDGIQTGGSGGVGENVGRHNERFNDYSGNTITGGDYNSASGHGNTLTNCQNTHCGGNGNTLDKVYQSAVFGDCNRFTSTQYSIVAGGSNKNCQVGVGAGSVDYSAVFGHSNSIFARLAHSLLCGSQNTVNGQVHNSVIASYLSTIYDAYCAVVSGEYADMPANNRYRIAVGNGTSSAAQNCFTVDADGAVNAASYNTPGADYAEYFEWLDGNKDKEDRRGLLVTLNGDRLVPAHGEDFIGAVSAAPSVVGSAYESFWHGKYKTDIFGALQFDDDGKPVISGEFDPGRKYIPRSERPEWSPVGLVGKLIITDDGSCRTGGYVSAKEGVGTSCGKRTNARVIRRVDDRHVEVIMGTR